MRGQQTLPYGRGSDGASRSSTSMSHTSLALLRPALPARQYAFPVGVHVLAHLRHVVALAEGNLRVALAAARQLIVIQLDAQPRTIRNRHATVDELDAPAHDHLILFGLPRIMRVASVGQIGTGRRH